MSKHHKLFTIKVVSEPGAAIRVFRLGVPASIKAQLSTVARSIPEANVKVSESKLEQVKS